MMIELRDANFIKERLSFLLSLFNDSQYLYILYLLDTFMGQLDLRSQLNAILDFYGTCLDLTIT